MTFKEFFAKKKIDLDLLEKADPELYTEFQNHFEIMGEKSFDHTKKFWFNKLRHLYHLATPEKALTQVETKIASQAEPLSSPTIEQTPAVTSVTKPPAFKPRFKAGNIAAKTETPIEATEKKDTAAEAYVQPTKKPPFKPRNIKPVSGELSEDAQTEKSKPGQTEVSDPPVTNPPMEEPSAARPAYKPKFNIRNIPKKPAAGEEQTGHTMEEKAALDLNDGSEKRTGQAGKEVLNVPETAGQEEVKAKPAYKPRFNVKAISKNTEGREENKSAKEAPELQGTPGEVEITNPPQASAGTGETAAENSDTSTTGKAAKPAYKPRFNAKNIKPQNGD